MKKKRKELVDLIARLESRLTVLHIVIEGEPACETCRLVHQARRVVREERGELTVPKS
jgi:hypothetical protein